MPENTDSTVAVNTDPVYVRVRDKDTKHEYSVVASTVDPQFQTVLEGEPAAYSDGQPIEAKHYAPKSVEPAGQKAETKKENV